MESRRRHWLYLRNEFTTHQTFSWRLPELAIRPAPCHFRSQYCFRKATRKRRKRLDVACEKRLVDAIVAMAGRLPLIEGRLGADWNGMERVIHPSRMLRQYLRVPVPAHRKAFTRLVLSSHTLGIKVLRWKERLEERVPRDSRLCRFCRRAKVMR
jgi:hypothetical protein